MTTFTFLFPGNFMGSSTQSMKKLAEYTGYSIASISRALDPRRSHLVKESTRRKIKEAVKTLNFSVNLSARRLKIQRTEVISVALLRTPFEGKCFSHEFASNAQSSDDIRRLGEAARQYGYDLKLEFFDEDTPLPEQFFDLNRTDGIIFCAYWGEEYAKLLAQSGIPAVFMSRYIDISRRDRPFVGIDRSRGFRQAVAELTAAGMKKIGWVGIPRTSYSRNSRILEELLNRENLYCEENFHDVQDYYQLRQVVEDLARMDAVFCGNDVIASWVVRELRARKIEREPLIIGYDNDPSFHSQSEFDTIGHAGNPLPELAVKMLDGIIRQKDNWQGNKFQVVDSEYIKRRNINHGGQK